VAIIYIPNYLYPTPSASGRNTSHASYTPSHDKRQTFTSNHSIAEFGKDATNFSIS